MIQGPRYYKYSSLSNSFLASILNTGTTSSVLSTIHSDHLGSTAVLSDASGILTELLDYHGYGNSRLTSGTATAKKTFIGQYVDTETSLSYLNARYYDSVRGQFLSEDSVFLGMGTRGDKEKIALLDPQLQNSYSYARDNPIALKDADGNWPQWMSLGSFASAVNAVYNAVTLGAGNRAEEMGRNGATVGGVAHVVGGVAFGVASVTIAALETSSIVGSIAIDVGVMSARQSTAVVGGAKVNSAPDFVVTPGSIAYPVPTGAVGPTPSISPTSGATTGSAFTGGSGGANGQVSTMRIMDPTPRYQNGYIKYENISGQGVNPYSGKTVSHPEAHFPIE